MSGVPRGSDFHMAVARHQHNAIAKDLADLFSDLTRDSPFSLLNSSTSSLLLNSQQSSSIDSTGRRVCQVSISICRILGLIVFVDSV